MAKATYWQRGETIDYKNATEATIPANTVISLGTRIGVAGTDIAVGEVGSLHVVGVFAFDKTESEKITAGEGVYFDAETGKITKTGEGKVPAGYAVAEAAEADTTVLVQISDPPAAAAAAAGGDVDSKIDSKLANYQKKITANGILKGDGNGTITAAEKGVDYQGVDG